MSKNLKDKYQGIKSIDIEVEENVIKFRDKTYKENEWFTKICSFRKIDETGIELENQSIKELPSTIYKFFCLNIIKTSKLGLIFAQILFLVISLITFSPLVFLQNSANFEIFKKMSAFMGIIYFLIALILFVKTIRGEKLYLRKVRGQRRFVHLSKKEYEHYLEIFKKLIENEVYYFKPLTKEIDNERISLREFELGDEVKLYEEFKNPNVFKYLLGHEHKTIEESLGFVKNCIYEYQNKHIYKLALTVNNELIGYIGLSKQDLTRKTCQIIYAIGENHWHKGYVYKGLLMFIPYLFDSGKEIIYAGHVKENENSGKVLLKSGFIRDEARDMQMIIHGENMDVVSYILNKNVEE